MSHKARSPVTRKASHAASDLNDQLNHWLSCVNPISGSARAIISPHAAYEYSGSCAAFAFKQIIPSTTKRIFILGPSHYLGLNGKCALSCATSYKTPLYSLNIDSQIYEELRATENFSTLSISEDEEEHSIEMQLPYIAKIMESQRGLFTIVPIVVGYLTADREAVYGGILSPYLSDPHNVFIISSDFCHWGKRFQYTYYDRNKGSIWESIQALDEMGMNLIERLDYTGFKNYLNSYGNTICGKYPISILLQAIITMRNNLPNLNYELKFIKYSQSEKCHNPNQSSVSYAAAALVIR